MRRRRREDETDEQGEREVGEKRRGRWEGEEMKEKE
jgi:hypothetical protein